MSMSLGCFDVAAAFQAGFVCVCVLRVRAAEFFPRSLLRAAEFFPISAARSITENSRGGL